MEESGIKADLNDAASLALLLYKANRKSLKQAIAEGNHGRFLSTIGFEKDVDLASEPDSIPVLPILRDRRIVLGEG
jgi:phosphosulfolactate phosphohydrolase-like enzyme